MEELTNLPPTAWVLIIGAAAVGFGISWLWRWYRNYSARKALRGAVTAAGSDHLVDMLVPDGIDRKSTRLNSSHNQRSRMPSSA